MNNMYRIDLYYNEGYTAQGKRFKVPHTTAFGFDMTVSLNGNSRNLIQKDPNTGTDFIIYDANKAGVKINQSGYLTLHITD